MQNVYIFPVVGKAIKSILLFSSENSTILIMNRTFIFGKIKLTWIIFTFHLCIFSYFTLLLSNLVISFFLYPQNNNLNCFYEFYMNCCVCNTFWNNFKSPKHFVFFKYYFSTKPCCCANVEHRIQYILFYTGIFLHFNKYSLLLNIDSVFWVLVIQLVNYFNFVLESNIWDFLNDA